MRYSNVATSWVIVSACSLACLLLYSLAGIAGNAENGAKSYTQFCAGCHGADKAGLANFTGGLEDLQAILDGETNQMPDFYGVFSDEEVADIFAFIQLTE